MMPVAILCGGKATRLGELTKDTPKSLVDVCGKPFIQWQLDLLTKQGYTDVVLLTGHLHQHIQEVVGDGAQWGVTVRYRRDVMDGIGTDGAIQWAQSLLGDEFMTLYGDSYLDCDYAYLEACFRKAKQHALLTWYAGVDYGLRMFRRYPAATAAIVHMPQPFEEIGSLDGLERLRRHLSR